MKLLVIVLNYRVTDLTIDCLGSLVPEIPRVPGMKVAVCENGTGGDAEQKLRAAIVDNGWDRWVELTVIFPNRGFAGGSNLIIRKALASQNPPDYFLLQNADTLVQPGAFETLVRLMDGHPQVGIAGSLLEWPDSSPQGSPFWFPGIASELDRGLKLGIVTRPLSSSLVIDPKSKIASAVGWVGGTSMIIRREAIDAIGSLDEGLYTYFDDVDFCLNAKRAGWPTWFVPESRIIHLEGRSTGIKGNSHKRLPGYWFQARRRFFLKNHGASYTALADAAFLAGFAIWRLRRRIQRKPDTDPQLMLIDSIRNCVFVTGFKMREVVNPALSSM